MTNYILDIRTPHGGSYRVREDGAISRRMDDGTWLAPSGQWTLRGIRHVKRTTEFIPFARLTERRLATLEPRFKNGKPQWTVCDRDHGTDREWGNTSHHGIAWIVWTGMTEAEAARLILGVAS